MVVIIRLLDLQLPFQSVPITTKVVSSNPADGGIKHHKANPLITLVCTCSILIVFANNLFSQSTPFSSTNNSDRHDIAEILLK